MRILLTILLLAVCVQASAQKSHPNQQFDALKGRFMDAFWKQFPSQAIFAGYGKYYEELAIPDSSFFNGSVRFSKQWKDSLQSVRYKGLNTNNRISYNIIANELNRIIWNIDTLKIHEWKPSDYNLGDECYTLITEPYAPLDHRLTTLSDHLKYAADYYQAAFNILSKPTKEYVQLAIKQNEGALTVFGELLTDSIAASQLSHSQKDTLMKRINTTTDAIKKYVQSLKRILADPSYSFRDFRLGETLYNEKFKYEMVTDYSAKQIFDKSIDAKKEYHRKMSGLANELWEKYCSGVLKPADTLSMIAKVIDKISVHHLNRKDLFDTLNKHVLDLQRFIVKADLFNFKTTTPIKVRKMPAFASGVAMASAYFPLPYQNNSTAYFNIADLSAMDSAAAESTLRENNNYMLQILSIHEAIPGHCMQGIYNAKSGDIVKSVFTNAAMTEGWAVYSERMMLENGWNNTPEMWLMYYKWRLRICANVIIDYGMHCLNYSKEDVSNLLINEAFQEATQVAEKYNRLTVSQVQLCSYFTGSSEIEALRDEFKRQNGAKYTLKDFHEKFLSFGSAPVKFIRGAMLSID